MHSCRIAKSCPDDLYQHRGRRSGRDPAAHGPEEVSPGRTVIAEILQQRQTAPSDLQARKAELLAALQAHDPDLTMLVNAATDLFNAMLQAADHRGRLQ